MPRAAEREGPGIERIGIAGAGTMGSGIAQLAALAGFEAVLHDPDPDALRTGVDRLRGALERGAERKRWSREEAGEAGARLRAAGDLTELRGCELVVEACPEDLELKRALFARLEEVCGADAILASNTSSLSIGAVAEGLRAPDRVCGMHFFNPPALMRLVEVVAAEHTSGRAIEATMDVAKAMGREPVRCGDSPGFIVNRCNRPFTLESLLVLDEGVATHSQIDAVLREDGGFRMGPFELMDLIGIDVNLEVARSLHSQRPLERWRPHPIQERMVAEGRLGRKSGRGFYSYGEGEAGARPEAEMPPPKVRRDLLERVICQLANEAAFAAGEEVATPEDIDAAMRLGLNHPRGPFEWVARLGPEHVVSTLEALGTRTPGARYDVAPLLART